MEYIAAAAVGNADFVVRSICGFDVDFVDVDSRHKEHHSEGRGRESSSGPSPVTGKGTAMSKLPHIKKPCRDCLFRKDTLQGWLGKDRATEILAADSFVCHKKTDMQCAGHMLINGQDNAFVRLAHRLRIPLELTGSEQVFDSKAACIEHHTS